MKRDKESFHKICPCYVYVQGQRGPESKTADPLWVNSLGAKARSQGLRDLREEMARQDPAPSHPHEGTQDELRAHCLSFWRVSLH